MRELRAQRLQKKTVTESASSGAAVLRDGSSVRDRIGVARANATLLAQGLRVQAGVYDEEAARLHLIQEEAKASGGRQVRFAEPLIS